MSFIFLLNLSLLKSIRNTSHPLSYVRSAATHALFCLGLYLLFYCIILYYLIFYFVYLFIYLFILFICLFYLLQFCHRIGDISIFHYTPTHKFHPSLSLSSLSLSLPSLPLFSTSIDFSYMSVRNIYIYFIRIDISVCGVCCCPCDL